MQLDTDVKVVMKLRRQDAEDSPDANANHSSHTVLTAGDIDDLIEKEKQVGLPHLSTCQS